MARQHDAGVQYYSFEIKRGMLQSRRGSADFVWATLLSSGGKRHFAPWSTWEFLFVTDQEGRHYCFPKHILPVEWFTMLHQEQKQIKWFISQETLDKYRLPRAITKNGVRYGEKLGEIVCQPTNWESQMSLPPVKTLQNWVEVAERQRHGLSKQNIADATNFNSTARLATTKVRGEGRQHSAILFEADLEVKLRSQCEGLGYGRLFRLGTHPAGRYVFTNMPCGSELDFFALSFKTPMLYINFAEIVLTGERIPTDAGRPASFLHATHGSHRSFYLLKNKSPGYDLEADIWYIVPSETIDTKERREISEKWLQPGKQETNGSMLVLSQGEVIDAYGVPGDDVITALLLLLLRQCSWVSKLRLGEGIPFNTADYLTNRQHAVHQQLDYYRHDTPFVGNVRKRKPRKSASNKSVEFEEDSSDSDEYV